VREVLDLQYLLLVSLLIMLVVVEVLDINQELEVLVE
jgi:hypothetical protein